jgi:hypothetical protein
MRKTKPTRDRKLVVEALERKAAGPLFGQCDDSLFRLAVGAFFSVKGVGEMQEEIERKADEIMDAVAKKRKAKGKKR